MLRNGEIGDWIGTFEGHKRAIWSCSLDKNAMRASFSFCRFHCVCSFSLLCVLPSASADFTAKIWNALLGDELKSFEHKHIVRACAFSEVTHLLLTGGMEKILRIFDLKRPDAPPKELGNSPGSVRTVEWLHSDNTILSSCTDTSDIRDT